MIYIYEISHSISNISSIFVFKLKPKYLNTKYTPFHSPPPKKKTVAQKVRDHVEFLKHFLWHFTLHQSLHFGNDGCYDNDPVYSKNSCKFHFTMSFEQVVCDMSVVYFKMVMRKVTKERHQCHTMHISNTSDLTVPI